MSRILGKALTIELAAIPSEDKQLDGAAKGINAARKTAGFARQSGKVMPEFCIHTLHPISLTFVGHGRVNAGRVDQAAVDWK